MEIAINIVKFIVACIFFSAAVFTPTYFAYERNIFESNNYPVLFEVIKYSYYVGVATAWVVLNSFFFKKNPVVANIISFLLYIYFLMLGGVAAGVGM
ncbi:MAG: hypothetical protein EOO52_15150 [Gammaproteobacteria bacterium]|nr:MAG: hypothetical protein EOO52_15150 [Gammaproteobacteria bacterium]